MAGSLPTLLSGFKDVGPDSLADVGAGRRADNQGEPDCVEERRVRSTCLVGLERQTRHKTKERKEAGAKAEAQKGQRLKPNGTTWIVYFDSGSLAGGLAGTSCRYTTGPLCRCTDAQVQYTPSFSSVRAREEAPGGMEHKCRHKWEIKTKL